MKNSRKNEIYVDALAEIRKSSNFGRLAKDADVRVRLASEVYNCRKNKELSQVELAKRINSTQKVISKIESGDTNIGINLLNRIIEELDFTSVNLSKIFNCHLAIDFSFKDRDSVIQSSNEIAETSLVFHRSDFINN